MECPRNRHCCDRNRLLDAAEEVVLKRGIGGLTLLAIARQVRLSKSGLLHHFSSKDQLIDAMVERKVATWQADVDAAIAHEPAGPGRVARAMLGMYLPMNERWSAEQRKRCIVLVAALVHDEKHARPLRLAHRQMLARIDADGLPAGLGQAVQLALNGLWFDWLFGLTEWTPARLDAVRRALERLAAASKPIARAARIAPTSRRGVAQRGRNARRT